jgi:DNA-binding Lrp family transcriptional regulator
MANRPPDVTDRRLLALLQANAREPAASLARKLGLSRSTVQSRIERLERSGVIAGYGVRVRDEGDPTALRAYVAIAVKPKFAEQVVRALRKLPEIESLSAVSGDFDLMARLVAETAPRLDALLDEIGAIDGIERTTTSVVLSVHFER